jgi:molecular chaperone HscB
MDYFELYGLPVSFNPDQKLVKQKFYELSKKFHPDFYINEGPEKQEEVLELSTVNNKAYQVLKDPQKRLHYILVLKNQLIEGENFVLPQDFLMEMMDVNEALMDLQFEPDADKLAEIKVEIGSVETKLQEELERLTCSFDNSTSEEQEYSLKSNKDLYYRNKYLDRIRESLAKIEGEV